MMGLSPSEYEKSPGAGYSNYLVKPKMDKSFYEKQLAEADQPLFSYINS